MSACPRVEFFSRWLGLDLNCLPTFQDVYFINIFRLPVVCDNMVKDFLKVSQRR